MISRRQTLKHLTVGLVVTALVVAIPGSAPRASPNFVTDAETFPEQQFYADSFGVPLDVAAEALAFQESATLLADRVFDLFPDSYSNSAIEHGAEFEFVLYIAGEEPDGLFAEISNFESEHPYWAGRIRVEQGRLSTNDLLAMMEEKTKLLEHLNDVPGKPSIAYDPARGTATIRTNEPESEVVHDISAALDSVGLDVVVEFSERTRVKLTCPPNPNGSIGGGRKMIMRQTSQQCASGLACTSGFAATLDGHEGILTAGHCPGTGAADWHSIMYANGIDPLATVRTYREVDNEYADAQFARELVTSTNLSMIYLFGSVWRQITQWTHTHPIGSASCTKGGRSADFVGHQNAYACGIILENVFEPEEGYHGFAWAKVEITDPGRSVRDGDSGGPVIFSTTARGLLSAGWFDEGETTTVTYDYSKIAWAMSALGGPSLYMGNWHP